MARQYFGTDGIRGRVGHDPMTAEFALRLASAAARVLAPNGGRVVIGKDTRVSGYMLESALEAGFVAAGMDALLLGPLPTPGIAYLTQAHNADLGVVISASHNPYYDNGIKFFDKHGAKLPDEVEERIEAFLSEPAITRESSLLGKAKRVDSAREDYQQFALSTVPSGFRLDSLKIVLDCSHGAGYKVGPRVLSELGAEIVPIGCSPNGINITVRMRPVLLTAGTTLLGNLVITLDPVFSGLALAIIFGIVASTLFTLIVVPVVYLLVFDKPVDSGPAESRAQA